MGGTSSPALPGQWEIETDKKQAVVAAGGRRKENSEVSHFIKRNSDQGSSGCKTKNIGQSL